MNEINLKSPYFKQLKRGKLGFFEILYLRHCGKRDYKRGVAYKEENNEKFISPFVEQEKNFFGVAVRKEKEVFKRTVIKPLIGIKIVELQKDGLKNKEKILSENSESFPLDEKLRNEKKKMPLSIREKELSAYHNLEKEIMRIRCEELCYIVLARIAAYWSGVQYAASKKNKDFKISSHVYMSEKDLLNQYFEDIKLWEEGSSDKTE